MVPEIRPGLLLAGHRGGEDRPKESEGQEQGGGPSLSSMNKEDGGQGVWPGRGCHG